MNGFPDNVGYQNQPFQSILTPVSLFPYSFSSCLLPHFLPLPPEPPRLLTRDRKEALAQTWTNVFYFTSHIFILKSISGKKQNPQAISISKFYFMDITAQVEANWKASPFLFCLKGTGRDILWVGGDTVREKWELGKRPEEVYTVPGVLLGSVHDPPVGLIS